MAPSKLLYVNLRVPVLVPKSGSPTVSQQSGLLWNFGKTGPVPRGGQRETDLVPRNTVRYDPSGRVVGPIMFDHF